MKRIHWDNIFKNAARISQVILAMAAIFAYFMTVRPLYQKELLSEEIAKKQLELKEKENILRHFSSQVEDFKSQKIIVEDELVKLKDLKNELNRKVNVLEKDRMVISNENEELRKRRDVLTKSIEDTEIILSKVKSNIRELVFREYLVTLRRQLWTYDYASTFFLIQLTSPCKNKECPEAIEAVQKIKSINLKNFLLESLEYFEGTKFLVEEDSKRFKSYMIKYTEDHDKELTFKPQTEYLIEKYLKNLSNFRDGRYYDLEYWNEAKKKEDVFREEFEGVLTGIRNEFIKNSFIKNVSSFK
jgi:hypothetical protein